ncbi:hypothetical protein QJQ45_005760 [Haematococcus lacustris]|nr:hypothetical protein QJQ45_005760 [Haematococcus lacustris]
MKAAVGRAHAEVQRLRDVEQSLMGTVDVLQGDLDDLQAAHQRLQDEHTALQQVASRTAATNHSLRVARRSLQGQVHNYRHKRRPHHSPLTFKQRQQLLVLEQHPVSVEVLRRCAEAGYGRVDSHGRPMGSMAEQLNPAGLAPSPTDIFIPTQEGPVGRPAARTAPYNAHDCLSTVRLYLETGVSRRALSRCRQFFVSEQCVLPNPHRPGKTSTVGREFHIVSTYMRRKTLGTTPELAVPAGAPPQQQQQMAAASTSRKREAPAAYKSRAAKQEHVLRLLQLSMLCASGCGGRSQPASSSPCPVSAPHPRKHLHSLGQPMRPAPTISQTNHPRTHHRLPALLHLPGLSILTRPATNPVASPAVEQQPIIHTTEEQDEQTMPPSMPKQQQDWATARQSATELAVTGLDRHWVSEAARQNLDQHACIEDRVDSLRHFAAVRSPDNMGHQGISQAVFDFIRHHYHEHSKPSPSCKDQRSYWVCLTTGDDTCTLVKETRRFFESSLLVMWHEFDDEQQHLEDQHQEGGQLQQPPSMRVSLSTFVRHQQQARLKLSCYA